MHPHLGLSTTTATLPASLSLGTVDPADKWKWVLGWGVVAALPVLDLAPRGSGCEGHHSGRAWFQGRQRLC